MKILIFAFLCVSLYAQNSSLNLSSGSGKGSGIVSLTMTMNTPVGVTLPAALQWSISFPTADYTSITSTEGQALIDAAKTIQCSSSVAVVGLIPVSITTNKCLATGINANTIAANGTIATITFTISQAPVDAIIPLVFSDLLGSDPQGLPLPLTATDSNITIICVPYKLTRTPVGPVAVFRNGVLQTAPGDYTSANSPGTFMPIITPVNWSVSDAASVLYTKAVQLSFVVGSQTITYWGYTLNRENWSCSSGKAQLKPPTVKKGK